MWCSSTTSSTPCVYYERRIFKRRRTLKRPKISSVTAFDTLYWVNSADRTDRVIINLKVIGTLTEGQRLCVRNSMFSVYEPGWVQALYRWILSEDRWANMEDVQTEVNDALRIMAAYLALMQGERGSLPLPPVDTCASVVATLAKELTHAVHGLQSLQRTYPSDMRMVATLAVLIDRIQAEVEKAQKALAVPPLPEESLKKNATKGGQK